MECHYKVLGVERNADDEAIKKAYRKAALRYHPDKNLHCLDQATERFRLVQAAYDVLSDPQERAWYDRHREEILHRKKYENYKDNSIDLWDYFSPSAYRGFGNDENGYYAVYGDVFRKIDAQDEPFRSDDADHEPLPVFGNAESDYDEVVHIFYSAWQAYCTHLSFVWENQYDVKEAPNRRVARIIEKENKKERDKHKKKRNELVRELVAFVRKRDPRVKAHKEELERVAAEKAQKAEEHRASMLRERVEMAALYDEANKEELMEHHERVSELESLMKDEFGFSSSEDEDEDSQKEEDEDEEYTDDLFCVACNKTFKSEMGMRNHQKSKKHKQNMNQLKEEMKEDDSSEIVEDESNETPHFEDLNPAEDTPRSNAKLSKKQKKQRKMQQKLLNNTMAAQLIEKDKGDEVISKDSTEGVASDSINSSNRELIEKSTEDNTAEQSNLECGSSPAENIVTTVEHEDIPSPLSSNIVTSNKNTKKKKQKQQQPPQSDLNTEPMSCGKCSQVFHSRNKLFQHLKQTGHSLPLENGKPSSKRKDKRTRR